MIAPHDRSHYLTHNIIIGSRPSEETFDSIINIANLIVNLEEDPEGNWYKNKLPQNIQYYHLPTKSGYAPLKRDMMIIVNNVIKHLSIPENIIYIHCRGGHGRSSTFAGFLLGIRDKLSYNVVIELLEKAREKRVDKAKQHIPVPETLMQTNFLKNELKVNK